MIRIILQEVALFLIPFALFAVVLVLQRRSVLNIESWSASFVWLALAGLLIVIGGFVYAGLFGERNTGPYVGPRIENGRPVPGGFR